MGGLLQVVGILGLVVDMANLGFTDIPGKVGSRQARWFPDQPVNQLQAGCCG